MNLTSTQRLLIVGTFGLTSFPIASPIASESCVDYTEHARWLGDAPITEGLGHLEFDGSIAFASDGSNFFVLDLSDPTAPLTISSTPAIMQFVQDLSRDGDIVYAANNDESVFTIDVSDLSAPVFRGRMFGISRVERLDVEGGLLVGKDGRDLILADVSTPSTPIEFESLDLGLSNLHIDRVGSVAYVAGNNSVVGELIIVDVSDLSAPVVLSTLPFDEPIRSVIANGDWVYVAGRSFYTIDVSDPANPVVVGSTPAGVDGPVQDLIVDGSLVYGTGSQRRYSVDVSDPSSPVILAKLAMIFQGLNDVTGFGLIDNEIVEIAQDRIFRFDLASPTPDVLTEVPAGSIVETFNIRHDELIVGRWGAIDVLDDTLTPTQSIDVRGHAEQIESNDDYLCAIFREYGGHSFNLIYSAFAVFDDRDGELFKTKEIPIWQAKDVALNGHVAYVSVTAGADPGVKIMDLRKNAPLVGEIWAEHVPGQLLREGDILWVASDFLFAYDVSDPLAPFERSRTLWEGGTLVAEDNVLCEYRINGLTVYDVTNPDDPVIQSEITLPYRIHDAALTNGILYVSSFTDQYTGVIDLRDPAAPVPLGGAPIGGSAIFVDDDGLLLGSNETYIRLPRSCSDAAPWSIVTTSNSTMGGSTGALRARGAGNFDLVLAHPADVTLDVFDVAGRHVRHIGTARRTAGTHTVSFDGRDADGRDLGAGMWFVRAQGPGINATARYIALR